MFCGVLAAILGLGVISIMSFAHVNEAHQPSVKAEAESDGDHSRPKATPTAEPEEIPRLVKLSDDQIGASNIAVSPVRNGLIKQRLSVPGVIAMDSDRVGRIAANVVGIVSELRKKLGDPVQKGEVIAVIESREVADARGEYISALVAFQLQSTLFERDRALWEKQFTPEQQFLKTRSAYTEARVRVDLARQKLLALNVDSQEITETLSKQASAVVEAKEGATAPSEGAAKSLRRYELRSPIAGRVVERRVDLGAPVGKEGQEAELYVIADLSRVWVELALPTADLENVKEGQSVLLKGSASHRKASGKIIFISPMLNNETRAARVIAAIDNPDLAWRPGTFVTAEIATDEDAVDKSIPLTALQKFNGVNAVFVRTADGFERRDVLIGKQDGDNAEVRMGLREDEQIAVSNTFILKAELGKSSAEESE
jgi:cobalt-zinc-cadmium efflux system membrane fusion protein